MNYTIDYGKMQVAILHKDLGEKKCEIVHFSEFCSFSREKEQLPAPNCVGKKTPWTCFFTLCIIIHLRLFVNRFLKLRQIFFCLIFRNCTQNTEREKLNSQFQLIFGAFHNLGKQQTFDIRIVNSGVMFVKLHITA